MPKKSVRVLLEWISDPEKKGLLTAARNLAWTLCGSDEAKLLDDILPRAFLAAYDDLRRARIEERGPEEFYMSLDTLVQVKVCWSAGKWVKDLSTENWEEHRDCWLLWYLMGLSEFTLSKSSTHVINGFGQVLVNGSPNKLAEFASLLQVRYPGLYIRNLDVAEQKKRTKAIRASLLNSYGTRFQVSQGEWGSSLDVKEIQKERSDCVYQALKYFVPWVYEGRALNRDQWLKAAKTTRLDGRFLASHLMIDQEEILDKEKLRISCKSFDFAEEFDHWRLPIPNGNGNPTPVNPRESEPHWPDNWRWRIENGVIRMHLDKPNGENSSPKDHSGGAANRKLAVRVDDEIRHTIRPGEKSKLRFEMADLVAEIVDLNTNTTLATCHLMDPLDLPDEGLSAVVEVDDGETLELNLTSHSTDQLQMTICHMLQAGIQQTASEGETSWFSELLKILRFFWIPLATAAALLITFVVLRTLVPAAPNTGQPALDVTSLYQIQLAQRNGRSITLNGSLDRQRVKEAYIEWGDPVNPDPQGGTRVYPSPREIAQDSRVAVLPITYEYGDVPSTGIRTRVRFRVVPIDPVNERTLVSERDLVVLPNQVILDPPAPRLTILSPQRSELVQQRIELKILASALTDAIQILALDPSNPTIYRYIASIAPPQFATPTTLSFAIDSGRLGTGGTVRLLVVSSSRIKANPGDTLEWQSIPRNAPRDETEIIRSGAILSPTPGAAVTVSDVVRAVIGTPNTYAAAVIRPLKDQAYFVQNNGILVTNSTPISMQVQYGGRDTYLVYVGVTQDPTLFVLGSRWLQLPTTDKSGRPIQWFGPVEVSKR